VRNNAGVSRGPDPDPPAGPARRAGASRSGAAPGTSRPAGAPRGSANQEGWYRANPPGPAGASGRPEARGFSRPSDQPAPRGSAAAAGPRGLSLRGALLLAGAFSLVSAVVDAETAGPSDSTLRTLFTVCFGLGGILAALAVHRDRGWSVVVAIPILYALAAAVSGGIYAERNSLSLVKEGGLDGLTSLVTHAPTLLVVTLIAGLLAAIRRGRANRARSRPQAAAHRPPAARSPR
jgi:hypothetical protein